MVPASGWYGAAKRDTVSPPENGSVRIWRQSNRRRDAALARRPVAGWGARIRTWEWRNQNPLPYHLATPHRGDMSEKWRPDHPGAPAAEHRLDDRPPACAPSGPLCGSAGPPV